MRITDSQIHMWENPKSGYPWEPLYNLERMQKDMKSAEVDRVVLVPTRHGFGDDLVGVNDYSMAAANAEPHRFAVMAVMDPVRPDAPDTLAKLLEQPGMKGVRLTATKVRRFVDGVRDEKQKVPADWLENGAKGAEWLWKELIQREMPVAILATKGTAPSLAPILESHPDLKVLLSHAGRPAEGPNPFDLSDILPLVKYPNLTVGASAFPRYTKQSYPFPELHEPIRIIYETFGPERMVWGTDYSTHSDRTTYKEDTDLFRVACDFIKPADLEWIMDKTLTRTLKWE